MKHTQDKILRLLVEDGMLPLFYHDDLEVCKSVIKACYEGGARLFEFTHRGVNAKEHFAALRLWTREVMPELLLGVGTVKNADTARFYANADADFIVCPIVDEDTSSVCSEHELLWIPGCMTPTEIARAEKLGAKVVKLFPGELLGNQFIISIRPLFPDLSFIVTGGVTTEKENLRGWINAGAKAVGMGSKLMATEWVDNKQFINITNSVKEALEILKQ
ncbi:bifunctional 4-hydroxy-2-oxoglutarate aldolase/2-dehydro-3-deoxy-phosphogluconate aldolase [Solitalea lacus]|uniref:bifunctional 4-hydroxy-2-oxoglutarate aldolase/2-dehydro-3-deoxy-phosphogluconate aldolase n=1 Tax=Solitalea lacus TaxID=2911172 RepID=UPI001EDC69C8|nr:bifunctional 4-hydroxy-2-oxoglutarate aldolase/2-dehydro-3-deoxy-phosphogluconate aldolase [Solitalea lacus]UKJ07443.1 bifunctional 4-hydroxy-2-oxoglutarate aldolase/2-dehydro-3-deoxy-phosphogluconate aldolase [Solitalea lacus]